MSKIAIIGDGSVGATIAYACVIRNVGDQIVLYDKLSIRDRVDIFQNVKTAALQIIEGKGATNYAIGLATAEILQALLAETPRILPVSSLPHGYHEIVDVCLSVPCIVNRKGVEQPLRVPMNENEIAGLRNSADTIRAAIRSQGF